MIIQDNIFTLKTEHDIKWYEVDFLRILKPCALLNHLQDVATKSADRFGIGMSFLEPRNYAWFLIKYHLYITHILHLQVLHCLELCRDNRNQPYIFQD